MKSSPHPLQTISIILYLLVFQEKTGLTAVSRHVPVLHPLKKFITHKNRWPPRRSPRVFQDATPLGGMLSSDQESILIENIFIQAC